MSYNYIVTAHKPSAVTSCVTGNFLVEDEISLIIAKNNRLEIYTITSDGLKLLKEVTIYGRITNLNFFRPEGEKKDHLFLLTCRHNAMILECVKEDDNIEIITRANGNVSDQISRLSETGSIVLVDPSNKFVGLRLYDGLFMVIPLEKENKELKAFVIRMEEIKINDIQFLHGCATPTIAFIYSDSCNRNVKTYEISMKEKELYKGPWKQDNVETEASILISVSFGGVIVIGQESITYLNAENYIVIAPSIIKNSTINCYTKVDDTGLRYLLGDMSGRLFLLLIEKEENSEVTVKSLRLEFLGEITIPDCMTYLDNGVIYIGSRLGDSQLVKLTAEPNEKGFYVDVIETFNNLGSIVDMCVVDLEKQGQGQLVTCSGAFKEGTLRIIRNGIGIQEHATSDLAGIKGIWPLKFKSKENFDNYFILSFVGQTRVLWIDGEGLESVDLGSFDLANRTLCCKNVSFDQVVQVTTKSIRLIKCESNEVVFEWSPTEDRGINLAAINNTQIACAVRNQLYYFKIEEGKIVEMKNATFSNELACIDINPLDNQDSTKFCVVGFWIDITIKILDIETLDCLHTEKIDSEIIPRSLILAIFEGIPYLLCALGDGTLFYFVFNQLNGQLSKKKRITLGTRPTYLKLFKSSTNTTNVFACSDRPTVIYSNYQKLVFSNVNLKEVNHMCPLNSESYPDSLALTTDNNLIIGTIDEIQKLHIRTVALGETPKRITYQEETETFGVLTIRHDRQENEGLVPIRQSASTTAQNITYSQNMATGIKMNNLAVSEAVGTEVEIYSFLIVDQHTFEILHAHQFMQNECALSIVSTKLGEDPNYYYIVGTCLINPDDKESKLGRILVFQWADGKLHQVAEKEIKGSPYSMTPFNGKLLTGINSAVRLYEWTQQKDFHNECSYYNNILALHLKTKGDFILIGDMMRSINLLAYKQMEGNFEEIGKEIHPNWMTAIEIIDDDIFLGAEHCYNLFVCQKESGATSEEERYQLQEAGLFHLGDFVNIIQHGSLVMRNSNEINNILNLPVLFGTVSGSIGMIIQLKENFFNFLIQVQMRLNNVIKSVGKIDHSFWRSFHNDRRTATSFNFVDGDLIESFLDLNREQMSLVVKDLKIDDGSGDKKDATVDDLIKIIEELTRIH